MSETNNQEVSEIAKEIMDKAETNSEELLTQSLAAIREEDGLGHSFIRAMYDPDEENAKLVIWLLAKKLTERGYVMTISGPELSTITIRWE